MFWSILTSSLPHYSSVLICQTLWMHEEQRCFKSYMHHLVKVEISDCNKPATPPHLCQLQLQVDFYPIVSSREGVTEARTVLNAFRRNSSYSDALKLLNLTINIAENATDRRSQTSVTVVVLVTFEDCVDK